MEWFADSLLSLMFVAMAAFIALFISVAFYSVFKALRKTSFGPKDNPPAVKEKEIIKEIIKVRCPYCSNIYDERIDKCPHCGGRHP